MTFTYRKTPQGRLVPRGGGIFNLIALIATIVLTGGIGLGILAIIDASSCTVNVFWGCGGSGGTGSGTNINGSILCVSDPNSCGQRNVGTLQQSMQCPSGGTPFFNCTKGGGCVTQCTMPDGSIVDQVQVDTCSAPPPSNASCSVACSSSANACGMTSTGSVVNGQCNATTPPNTSCPTPTIGSGGFTASPTTVNQGGTTVLKWTAQNATDCTITSDTGYSFNGGATGSVTSDPINQSTIFTLTCEDGTGGNTATAQVKVIVTPHYKEL